MGEPAILPFDWADPFDLNHQLTDEERLVRDTAEGYAQEKLQPRVTSAYLDENFDREILTEMGELGLLGATIPHEYGGAGLGYVSYGLIARAVERGRQRLPLGDVGPVEPRDVPDLRLRLRGTATEISAEARERRMGRLLRPDRARRRAPIPEACAPAPQKVQGGYVLSGTKMWITNSPIADVFVVWAKSDAHDGKIRGFVLEKGWPGLSAPKIKEKLVAPRLDHRRDRDGRRRGRRRRAAAQCRGAEGPVRLPQPRALRHRLGIDGRGRGLLRAPPANIRSTASSSAVPSPPTSWCSSSSPTWRPRSRLGLQAALRVGRRLEAGELIPETISLIKRNNCGKALDIARIARDMHGGNGISAPSSR